MTVGIGRLMLDAAGVPSVGVGVLTAMNGSRWVGGSGFRGERVASGLLTRLGADARMADGCFSGKIFDGGGIEECFHPGDIPDRPEDEEEGEVTPFLALSKKDFHVDLAFFAAGCSVTPETASERADPSSSRC